MQSRFGGGLRGGLLCQESSARLGRCERKERSVSYVNMDSSAARGSLPFGDIDGKIAVLTLGTEDYEGINLAVEFVKRGCRMVLLGCPLARLTKACNQVLTTVAGSDYAHGSDFVKAVVLDATRGDQQTVEKAIEQAWCAFGGIDIVLSYAANFRGTKPVIETSEIDYDEIMAVNLKASWSVSKSAAKKMQQERRAGSVLFLTSISGTERGIYPGVSIYGTSMAALNHLTKMMAMELGKYGIRVNAIACGLAEPNVLLEASDKSSLENLANRVVPVQRWLQFPNDIIGVLLWLASDSSTFVTGTITIVDGGLSLRRPRMGEYRSRL